jgi:LacI family transcriptional regulator
MKSNSVTMKEIAENSGVSHQTVWRALNNKTGILPETRAEILEVAERLGYRRNRIAGGLRTNRSSVIGLIVINISIPFTGQLARGVEEAASRQGKSVLLMNTGDDFAREKLAMVELVERRVEGLILYPAKTGRGEVRILPDGLPTVTVNRKFSGLPASSVTGRSSDVSRVARYFAERGHTRIGGLFGQLSNPLFLSRARAYKAELARLGVPVEDRFFRAGENSIAFSRSATVELLSQASAPTALFAAGNRETEGALLGLRDLGLRHGRDISLVGFDAPYASLLDPPLPVMMLPARTMGELAVDALHNMITHQGSVTHQTLPIDFRNSEDSLARAV